MRSCKNLRSQVQVSFKDPDQTLTVARRVPNLRGAVALQKSFLYDLKV